MRTFLERAARKIARQGGSRWRKRALLAVAALCRLLRGELAAAGRYLRYLGLLPRGRGREAAPAAGQAGERALKLIPYTFCAWDEPICVVSPTYAEAVRALAAAGYTRVHGFAGLEALASAGCRGVVLLDCLHGFSRDDLFELLTKLETLKPERVAAFMGVFPDDSWSAFDEPADVRTFESREWWNARFAGHGYQAEEPPREPLGRHSAFLFRRAAAKPPPAPAISVSAPEAVFLMPPKQNAFRWVTESLAAALREEGCAALVAGPEQAEAARYRGAPYKITWAHYWDEYRRIRVGSGRHFEYFVTNFRMKPRSGLTPWVREMLNRPSEKLAPTAFCRQVLEELGAPADRIHLVPHGYSPEFAEPAEPLPLATHKSFRFLAVVNSYDPNRYGLDLLLEAYRREFSPHEDVCLVLKDYGAATAEIARLLHGEGPEILYYANFLSKPGLARFYAACSASVSPFRGEGFGMKILDAALQELPLILPLFGGPVDYSPADLVQPVKYRLCPAGPCLETREMDWAEELEWCEPDAGDLAARMREVFERREHFQQRAKQLRQRVADSFPWAAAARALIEVFRRTGP